MEHEGSKNIRLVVDDERTLYTPFSPEPEFNEPVKRYIKTKIAGENDLRSISLTVISKQPIDEDKFRSAVSDWIEDEKALFRHSEKETVRMLVGLLVFGSILLVLSLALQKQFDLLKYTLLPIMGSLALSKATGILVIDMPVVRAKRWLINELEKNSSVTFEYEQETAA